MRTNVSRETFLLAVRRGIFRRGKGFPKLDLWLHFHMQGGSWQLPDEAEQQGNKLVSYGFFKICVKVITPLCMLLILYGQLQSFFNF